MIAIASRTAMGKVPIVSRRGFLPELVRDGETGLVIDETPEAVAGAIARLAKNPELRLALGLRARQDAVERFSPDALAHSDNVGLHGRRRAVSPCAEVSERGRSGN
jgi:glycosyltransferase involved in cell wall biosynthesis